MLALIIPYIFLLVDDSNTNIKHIPSIVYDNGNRPQSVNIMANTHVVVVIINPENKINILGIYHARIHTRTHTHTRTHIHTSTHTYTPHAYTHTEARTHIHTRTHARTHAHI